MALGAISALEAAGKTPGKDVIVGIVLCGDTITSRKFSRRGLVLAEQFCL
jgi:hypothetical protein